MSNLIKREDLDFYGVVVLGVIGFIFAIWWNYSNPHLVVKYDCSIAEISPDYPVAVKEGCRKLRAENYNKDLQKPK
jgi:hypothetical protein